MPVFVVPADTSLGVGLVQALRRVGGEVRAYATGDGDVRALRAAGAFVAVGDLDDEGRLDAAMTDVHTVVSLHADPLAPDADALDHHLRTTVTAARKAAVSRLVARSVPRPRDGGADDALRRVCADVEGLLADLPLPTIAVRTSLVDTPGLRDAVASVSGHLDGDMDVAPLDPADVVDGLVALDDARGRAAGHATFRLQGQPRTVSSYLDLVGAGLVGRRYTPRESVPMLVASLTTPWVEPVDDRTADLLAFGDLAPRSLSHVGGG